MRIAMIGQKGMPALHGGVERHVHELSVRLAERGFDVQVYARAWYTDTSVERYQGVTIVHLPSIKTKHLDAITHTFVSVFHAMFTRADVIHFHGVGPSLLAWIPRLFAPRTRIVSTFHSLDRKHEKWGAFARAALRAGEWASCRFAHRTVTVSEGIRTYVEVVYGKQTDLIPNAVPPYARVKTTDALDAFGLESGNYFLVVSRLIPCKGIQYLIDAFIQLQDTNALRGKKLAIVGDGFYSDRYVKKLHDMAAGNPDIVFTGFQSGVALSELYSHAFMKIHPSDNEGLPLTVLEAMSYGLPVLASDIAGHRDLISHPEYTFEAGSAQALKVKLVMLLGRDPAELVAEGDRNRQKVRDQFGWDEVVDKTIALYLNEVTSPTAQIATA